MAAAQGEQDDGQNHDGHAEGEGPGGDVEVFDADEKEGVVGGAEGGEQERGEGSFQPPERRAAATRCRKGMARRAAPAQVVAQMVANAGTPAGMQA